MKKRNNLSPIYWMPFGLGLCLLFVCCQDAGPALPAVSIPSKIDFNQHVRPILSDRCWACHGPDAGSREANLRLDTEEGAFAALDSSGNHFAIVSGIPRKSELYQRISSDDPEEVMPPPESNLSLSAEEIEILRRWIKQGAEWQPHWAFVPPQWPEVPTKKGEQSSAIDHFIETKLQEKGMTPAPEADKASLLRRVSLDLTGLPPTVAEVEAFLTDQSPDAYEKQVDRLLASPHYGEQQATHWLDLARYADTHGYQADYYRPHWPWRDWVVQALNDNMPYDQFVSWQLAGDLYPNPSQEQILATGFNRNHPQNAEGGIVQEEFRVEYVADRVQTFSTAFMGLTLQCARCHDHKYDPLSQKEFYQVFGFFNQIDEAGQITWNAGDMPGPTMLLPDSAQAQKRANLQQAVAQRAQALESYTERQVDSLDRWLSIHSRTRLDADPPGLLAHIPLEQISVNRIPNRLGRGEVGKLIDPSSNALAEEAPQVVKGKVGNGLRLNGDDALSFPGLGQFSRTEAFSIGMWVQIPAELSQGVIFHSNKGSALYTLKGYQVSVENDHFEVILAHDFPHQSLHLTSIGKVPRDKWLHLMLTYDGSSQAKGVSLYVDGESWAADVQRDHLVKDMIFYGDAPGKSGVETMLKVGARWRGKGLTGGLVDEIKVFDRALSSWEAAWVAKGEAPNLGAEDQKRSRELTQYLLALHDESYHHLQDSLTTARKEEAMWTEFIPEIMVMDERKTPRPTYLLERGSYEAHGEEVQPGSPEAVLPWPEDLPQNRLGLTQWLFLPENPLTARVAVNQQWLRFFGRGLVKSAEDWGSQGDLPSHPALLDWLAKEFQESGWDVKALQKQLLLSAAYRRASQGDALAWEQDPENVWLARGPKRRLSAEMLRDQALRASGLLVPKLGGEPVKPYQPKDLWAVNLMGGKYEQDHGEKLYRRSLYTFWKRTNPPPSMNTFDAPTRSYCVIQREETQTPLQALVSMNDPQFVEAARKLAEQMLLVGGSGPASQIVYGYRALTSQFPTAQERRVLLAQYERSRLQYSTETTKAEALLSMGESPVAAGLDQGELAAMSVVAMTIMNVEGASVR